MSDKLGVTYVWLVKSEAVGTHHGIFATRKGAKARATEMGKTYPGWVFGTYKIEVGA